MIGTDERGTNEETIRAVSVHDAEDAMLKEYLTKSVTAGTAQSYEPGIRRWKNYIATMSTTAITSEYLHNIESEDEKARRLVLYMAYLYMEHGLREEQIKRAITAVAYHFGANGESTAFFRLAIVERGKAAGARTLVEKVKHEEQRSTKTILPVCMDIVMEVRAKYWTAKSWDTKGTDSKAIWLVIALGFDSGPRIGNLTLKDGKNREDHCIRAGHLSFLVQQPPDMAIEKVKGGPTITNYLKSADVSSSMVLSVDMVYMTSKMHKKTRTYIENPKVIARRTDEESMVLDDLLEWFKHSSVKEGDELLTRYSHEGKRKVVIRKDVRNAIKEAVSGLGLPSEHFSTKSLRSGFSTHASANGMSGVDVNRRGGWVEGSNVPGQHYIRQMQTRGAFALPRSASGEQNHGIQEINRMLPARSDNDAAQARSVTR